MPRQVRNAKIDTRTARSKLAKRREPYWTSIGNGAALGYRRGAKGGTWIARLRDETGRQHYESLGAADDALDADGMTVLDFQQAVQAAQTWFSRRTREVLGDTVPKRGTYTVADACDDYVKAYRAGRTIKGNGRQGDGLAGTIATHIKPTLGNIAVKRLSKPRIQTWLTDLAESPPRLRSKEGAEPRYRELDTSQEGVRRRRSTANRVLSVLKAALNYAHAEGKIASDDAWRHVKPYRDADAARTRYLSDDEARRLVNASDPEFRPLVLAALHTGARYGELAALVREDYNPDAGTVFVRVSKSGKPRHIVLTADGQKFFATLAAKAQLGERLLRRESGAAWGKSHQARFLADAIKAAKIAPVTFHELRHTYASRLVMKGAPLAVVAAQLGHADTRMVEKHYGHLAPSYIADTVRAAMGSWAFDGDETDNVVPLTGRAG